MWNRYSTGSNLNTYSALIQNFYSHETAPYPAIHIALNTGTVEGEQAGVKAYIRCVPFSLLYNEIMLSCFSSKRRPRECANDMYFLVDPARRWESTRNLKMRCSRPCLSSSNSATRTVADVRPPIPSHPSLIPHHSLPLPYHSPPLHSTTSPLYPLIKLTHFHLIPQSTCSPPPSPPRSPLPRLRSAQTSPHRRLTSRNLSLHCGS